MSREALPNRREQETIGVNSGGRVWTVSFGRYEDGRVAEIFAGCHKLVGGGVEAIARDAMILASFALQHGASVEELRDAMTRGHDGAPASLAGDALEAVAAAARSVAA